MRWKRIGLIGLGLAVAVQLVPYGRDHDNPAVTKEPAWDAPRTRALAARACFDCHSNETRWPWYSHVAPFSWLVQHDVDEARSRMSFSAFDRPQKHADDAAEELEDGEMPPEIYLPLHAEARLTRQEKAELVAGLRRTLGSGDSGHDEHGHDHDDDD